jgi:hypothetical protein
VTATAHVAGVEDQVADPFRVTHRVGDGDRRALRYAEQCEAFDAGGVDHALEIADPVVDRESLHLAIGQPAAALVVTHDRMARAKAAQPMPPNRASPVMLEMGEPVGRLDDRRTLAVHGVGEAHAVRRCAEPDALLHRGAILRR